VRLAPGFSLIELIIVILIASLLAAVIFSRVSFQTHTEQKVGIRKLKERQKAAPPEGELVCIKKCKECYYVVKGKRTPVGSQLKPLEAYILDDGGTPQSIDFGRMDDQKICLRFHYYPNGSTSQMILESEEKAYFVPSYFGEVEVFESVDDAAQRWMQYRKQLDGMGTFF